MSQMAARTDLHDQTHPGATLPAAFWMAGTLLSFSAMAIAGREAGRQLDTFEIMSYRSLIGFAAVASIGAATGQLTSVSRDRLGLHVIRNVVHFAGQNLWFLALTLIPLAQVFALEFTYPIWVVLLAPLLLGERMTRRRILVVLAGFLGILVVTRPGIVPVSAGTLAALAAALGFAGSAIATKRLTADQSVYTILFWLTLMQLLMGLALANADGLMTLPDAATLPFVIIIGLTGLSAHFCLTTALSLAPATIVVPMEFLRLPLIAGLAAAIYGESLDPFVLIGGAVIFAANYANIRQERRHRHASPADAR
jgi:drug/metabolite transporter (DMT)-like permease